MVSTHIDTAEISRFLHAGGDGANTAKGAFRHRATDVHAPSPILDAPPKVDPDYKAVRVTEMRDDGFVEFDFIVGDPDIFAEMLLTEEDFVTFCQEQGVTPTFSTNHAVDDSGLGTTLREVLARVGRAPTHHDTSNQEG